MRVLGSILGSILPVIACHHDVTVLAPDIAQAQTYRLYLVNNETPPAKVADLPGGGSLWVVDAQLVPVDLGRASDGRIFDDRSGNGNTGGNTRDSSAVSGRVSDVRSFQERLAGTIVRQYRDSAVVDVVRHGDTLFVKREVGISRFVYVDTAVFFTDILVMRVHKWLSDLGGPVFGTVGLLSYNVTRPDPTRD